MMGGALIDGRNVESGQFRTRPSRTSRSWIDRMPRIVRGQACYHHHRPENPAAYADLIEPARPSWTPVTSTAIARGRRGLPPAKRHPSSDWRTHGARLSKTVQSDADRSFFTSALE